jgi:small neutral amino acid transporter SnatA (MarC family)
VFAILVISAVIGQGVLSLFGVSLPAFRAAGGLVIVQMGLEMLGGQMSRVQHEPEDAETAEGQLLVPFAMPIVAGPGAITTVITLAVTHRSGLLPLVALAESAGLVALLWLTLRVMVSNERLIQHAGTAHPNALHGADSRRDLLPVRLGGCAGILRWLVKRCTSPTRNRRSAAL